MNSKLALFQYLAIITVSVLLEGQLAAAEPPEAALLSEFVYESAPTPECHASTIAQKTGGSLIAAWFGGTEEGEADVGIWISHRDSNGWSRPVEVATGVQANGKRHPCWNPVLFQMPAGPLVLFYKVGPSPSTWWGMRVESIDDGKSWSEPKRLPDDIAGPIKNKPILLDDGTLLCGSSTEDQGWRVHMEFTRDAGKTWKRTDALCDGKSVQAIQPTILRYSSDKLQILCRARSGGRVLSSWSEDRGHSWSPLAPIADLPNPNSGIDAVTLADGRHLLVYNHTPRGRSPLNVSLSSDGKTWKQAATLENERGEYSYPAVIQTKDGRVHITYTWKRQKIRHVVLDPEKLASEE